MSSKRKAILTQIFVTDLDLPLLYGALEEKKKKVQDQVYKYRIEALQKKIWSCHSELIKYNNNKNQATLDLAQGILDDHEKSI